MRACAPTPNAGVAMINGQASKKGTIYVNFGRADAEDKFKQVLEYLCVR